MDIGREREVERSKRLVERSRVESTRKGLRSRSAMQGVPTIGSSVNPADTYSNYPKVKIDIVAGGKLWLYKVFGRGVVSL